MRDVSDLEVIVVAPWVCIDVFKGENNVHVFFGFVGHIGLGGPKEDVI